MPALTRVGAGRGPRLGRMGVDRPGAYPGTGTAKDAMPARKLSGFVDDGGESKVIGVQDDSSLCHWRCLR